MAKTKQTARRSSSIDSSTDKQSQNNSTKKRGREEESIIPSSPIIEDTPTRSIQEESNIPSSPIIEDTPSRPKKSLQLVLPDSDDEGSRTPNPCEFDSPTEPKHTPKDWVFGGPPRRFVHPTLPDKEIKLLTKEFTVTTTNKKKIRCPFLTKELDGELCLRNAYCPHFYSVVGVLHAMNSRTPKCPIYGCNKILELDGSMFVCKVVEIKDQLPIQID